MQARIAEFLVPDAMSQPDLFDLPRTARAPDGWRPASPPDLRGERRIRVDFETTGLQWWNGDRPVGLAYWLPESGRHGYLPFGHRGGGNLDEAVVKRFAHDLRGMHIDNANTRFDIHMARAWGVPWADLGCTFGDVQHRAALLDDHRLRLNLDQLGKDFLGIDTAKIDLGLRDKGRIADLPAWEVDAYAVRDVELVDLLIKHTDPLLHDQDLLRVLDLEEQIIPVVCEMEANGAYLDMDTLARWRDEARQELKAILWAIYRETGVLMTSPDSSKDLVRLFKALQIPITAFTGNYDKHGNPTPSFTADVLSAIAHPTIKQILYAGQLADLLSKYLDKYFETARSDGWVRYNLHQLRIGRDEHDKKGTISGRFSSAGDDFGGFNVQQVVSPKKQKDKHWCEKYVVRNLFKPKHGQWVAVDADQIEYRIFAHFARSKQILGAYNASEPFETMRIGSDTYFVSGPHTDYHAVVQAMLMTVKPDIKRKHTKITNFCKLFGSGLIKFALTLETISEQQYKDLTLKYAPAKWKGAERGARERAMKAEPALQEAASVFDAYDAKFPDAKTTLKLASNTARDRGYVHTILGRRARFPNGERLHSALNRVVQGTAADINKRMLIEVYRERKRLGLTLRMTVHDEVDADLMDPGMLPEVERVFNQQLIPLQVPILWTAEIGPSWGEAKGKA